jgi:D-alanyl-D-alanine carboxypeptidase
MLKFKLPRLDLPRKLLALSLFLLVALYPGANSLQTIVIKPGKIKSYDLTPPPLSLYPKSDGTIAPYVSARGVIIQDANSKAILLAKNPDIPLMPASTTKIMTALVARDYWTDLKSTITVLNEDRAIGQTIELKMGETLTVGDILKGLLIHSGNDAALALADNYPGGYSSFVAAMNAKAKSLHLEHTVYKNPSGIEQYGHITTPRDLATLASVAMADSVIADIVSTKFTAITDVTGTHTHPLESTNELLGIIPGLKGLKTGWTTRAGECLVSYIERDGHAVVVVVLNSLDRFGESASLIDWVYKHHEWIVPIL